LDIPSSYEAMRAELGSMIRSRTRDPSADAELKQPDRLEIGAEEGTRRAEHIVGVRVVEVARGPGVEQADGERAARDVVEQHAEERAVDRPLGEPELMPIEAEAIVQLAGVLRSALRAAMPRIERVVGEQCSVAFAAPPGA
jgi:hypothetical protein